MAGADRATRRRYADAAVRDDGRLSTRERAQMMSDRGKLTTRQANKIENRIERGRG